MQINTKFNINDTVSYTSPSGVTVTGPIKRIGVHIGKSGVMCTEYVVEIMIKDRAQNITLVESQLTRVPRTTKASDTLGDGRCTNCIHCELSIGEEPCLSCETDVFPWSNYVYKGY